MVKTKNNMKATNLNQLCSSGNNPVEWEQIPEIKECRPKGKGYVELSLQRLDTPKSIILVQWYGAKNGSWYADGDIFRITKR